MGKRRLFVFTAVCLWMGACGFDDGEWQPETEPETERDRADADSCQQGPCDDEENDAEQGHEVVVIPTEFPSGTTSGEEEEAETTSDSSSDQQSTTEPESGPEPEPGPTEGDLQCADDSAICRFCGPPVEVVEECPPKDPRFECQVFELVNEKRVAHDLHPLEYDATLAASAKIHAMDLNHCDYFAHDSLDGTTFFERCADNGYQGTCTGENIGGGQRTPQDVMDAWIASPGHRHNILYDRHTHMGIAFYEGDGSYGRYWLKHFGRQ